MNALEDMSQVLTDARITPHMAGGKVEGFIVTEIKPRGIFDALGLKNGDVLIRVNNYDIVSPERAIQVLSGLKGANEVDLDLIRGGKRMSFHYQVR
jgi:general secretion pathway protein C